MHSAMLEMLRQVEEFNLTSNININPVMTLPNPEWPSVFEKYKQMRPGNPRDTDHEPGAIDEWQMGSEIQIYDKDDFFKPGLQQFQFKALELYSLISQPAVCRAKCRQLVKSSNDRCGEVYNLLGIVSDSLEEALDHYRTALKVTKQCINWNHEEVVTSVADNDHWDVPACRSYQRAQMGIAVTLVKLNRWEEALVEYEKLDKVIDSHDPRPYSSYVNWRYYYPLVLMKNNKYEEALDVMEKAKKCYTHSVTSLVWNWNTSFCQMKLKKLRKIDPRYFDMKDKGALERYMETSLGANVKAAIQNHHLWELIISHLDPEQQPKELPNCSIPKFIGDSSEPHQAFTYWNRHKDLWLEHKEFLEAMLRIRNRYLINRIFVATSSGMDDVLRNILPGIDLNDEKKTLKMLREILRLGCDLTVLKGSNLIEDLTQIQTIARCKLANYLALLSQHQFNIAATNGMGLTALHVACYYMQNVKDGGILIAALIKLGVDPWCAYGVSQTPAMMAANQGNWVAIQAVLDNTPEEERTVKRLVCLFYQFIGSSCYLCVKNLKRGCQRCDGGSPHDKNVSFEKSLEVLVAFGLKYLDCKNYQHSKEFLDLIGFSVADAAHHPLMALLKKYDGKKASFAHHSKPYTSKMTLDASEIDCCTHCGATAYSLKKCSRCLDAKYCSRFCQVNDWKTHKSNCK